jgi:inorganic pyrophosphatase
LLNPPAPLQVKPIGVLQMLDQGERDDKIIAVHCHDPSYRNFNDISELPSHRLAEIRSFFEDYKKNEHKVRRGGVCGVVGWLVVGGGWAVGGG